MVSRAKWLECTAASAQKSVVSTVLRCCFKGTNSTREMLGKGDFERKLGKTYEIGS